MRILVNYSYALQHSVLVGYPNSSVYTVHFLVLFSCLMYMNSDIQFAVASTATPYVSQNFQPT